MKIVNLYHLVLMIQILINLAFFMKIINLNHLVLNMFVNYLAFFIKIINLNHLVLNMIVNVLTFFMKIINPYHFGINQILNYLNNPKHHYFVIDFINYLIFLAFILNRKILFLCVNSHYYRCCKMVIFIHFIVFQYLPFAIILFVPCIQLIILDEFLTLPNLYPLEFFLVQLISKYTKDIHRFLINLIS